MKKKLLLNEKPAKVFVGILSVAYLSMPLNAQLLDPMTQAKFVNPLPIPAQVDAATGMPFEMEMNETVQWLGLTDPVTLAPLNTKVWGYGPLGGPVSYPGPTLIAKNGIPTTITWHNNLPAGHFLPVDPTLHLAHPHGSDPAAFYAAGNVPAVVHLHGGKTESASDGLPEAWFTQGFVHTGPQFVKQAYTYANNQEAATLWYHDHALGITRLNVYAGLAGFYKLEDPVERGLVKRNVLPKGKHDIEIVIQDRMFDAAGQLFLPSKTGDPWFMDAMGEPLELPYDPSVVAEFFGNFIVVNGVIWPFLDVEPRPYRFRLLNGSDSRFYVLEFGNGIPFLQVGTDNGLLPNAVPLTRLIIAPGERAEIVVDFSGMANQAITLFNYGPDSPFKGEAAMQMPADPNTTGQIMQFRVTKSLIVSRGLPIPTVIAGTSLRAPLVDPGPATVIRQLALFEGEDADGRLQPLLGIINGDMPKADGTPNGSLAWFEPITENPALNAVEEWWIYNATEDAHPMHLHLVSFQIIDRQPFEALVDVQEQIQHDGRFGIGGYIAESTIAFTGPADPPAENEKGWKDTFIVPPGYVGRIKAKFDLPGRYVWHCHILSHEDHEMMRPFYVGPMPAPAMKSASADNGASYNGSQVFRFYPNPLDRQGFVEFSLNQSSTVGLKIYDLNGRVVFSEDLGNRNKGYYTYKFNVDQLNDGLYLLELKTGESIFKDRIVIKK